MPSHHSDHVNALRRALGTRTSPPALTQRAFDGDDGHLRRLIKLAPEQPASASDLWDYAQDLLYSEIQAPLLLYLLPWCLEAWHDDLRGTHHEYGAFVEHFYPVLADRGIFDNLLTPAQTDAVSSFIRESLLEEIDDQRGLAYRGTNARPYRWVTALTTYGVLLPDIERAWSAWWSIDTVGRAVAAIQYASALMYPDDENPIFAPWTREEGGGPPALWDFGGHLYTHCWLPPNVECLRRTLSVTAIGNLLTRATSRLRGQPEHGMAAFVFTDLPSCTERLGRRCDELPALLAVTQQPNVPLTWSAAAS